MFKSLKTLLILLAALAFTGIGSVAVAQITLSPYSRYGLGDPISPSSTRNFSMGSIGIGSFDGTTINRINPASYADLRLTTLDFSGYGQYSRQKSSKTEAAFGNAGFHNVSFGFSNKKGFGLVMGLAPYSSVGYNVVLQDSIFADTAFKAYTETYTADGGLSQFYIGAGVRVLRHFNVGLNLTYAFGTTNTRTTTDFTDNVLVPVNINQTVSLSGFIPQTGIQYGDTIRINKEVERIKVIEEELKRLDGELALLDKEESSLNNDNQKAATWTEKANAEVKAIEDEKASLDSELKGLLNDEVGNEKAISKIQEKSFRLEKKRKALQQDIKARNRESVEALARIGSRRQKIKDRQAALAREAEEVKAGRKPATEIKKKTLLVRGGATFEPGSSINGEILRTYDNTLITDTLTSGEGSVRLPMKYGLGFSIVRPGRWSFGADASVHDWTKFDYFGDNQGLLRAVNFNAGGEWIPDLLSKKYGNRIAYRAGVYHHGAFMKLNDQSITENGVTFGVGLPIGFISATAQNFSRINLGVGIGRRGTMDGNLLEETTFHFRLGVNLNDIWFIKRRID